MTDDLANDDVRNVRRSNMDKNGRTPLKKPRPTDGC
jgi:hypothetical protein